jgi:hypothetical protein
MDELLDEVARMSEDMLHELPSRSAGACAS